jgi:pimeloyl-ACP methyl ester carboxylesterase
MFPKFARRPTGSARDRRHDAERLAALTVSAALVVLLAACSSNEGGHATTSTVATTTTTSTTTTTTTATTTTTTTTTLPVPVAGTSILRARVAALPPGDLVLPALSEGSAAWSKMVPIAYQSFGSGPDLLLIAGQDGTLSWWDPALLLDLSGHYSVTVFDLPGAGYSGASTAPLSLAWLADMTAGLALTIGLSDPIVLGWGLGGEVAMSLAERHPGIASSLVLVDTSVGGAGTPQPAPEVVRLLAMPGSTPLALSGLLFPPTTAGLQERVLWQNSLFVGTTDWLTATTIKAEAALQAAIWKRSNLAAGLSQVTIPVLVVSGADDVVFPRANANLLAVELLHATLVVFASSGYGAITQDEPAFVVAVEKFTG